MPKKAPGELTQHEVSLLTIASRLLDIIRQQAEIPPPEAQQEYWKIKVKEELVHCYFVMTMCIYFIFLLLFITCTITVGHMTDASSFRT
jgi:hypothetical protein